MMKKPKDRPDHCQSCKKITPELIRRIDGLWQCNTCVEIDNAWGWTPPAVSSIAQPLIRKGKRVMRFNATFEIEFEHGPSARSFRNCADADDWVCKARKSLQREGIRIVREGWLVTIFIPKDDRMVDADLLDLHVKDVDLQDMECEQDELDKRQAEADRCEAGWGLDRARGAPFI